MTDSTRVKPTKPYPTFPLTPHAHGQWCKRIRGRVHRFGVRAETAQALERYLASAADLHAGRVPRQSTLPPDGVTVKDVGTAFLGWPRAKVATGEIGLRCFNAYGLRNLRLVSPRSDSPRDQWWFWKHGLRHFASFSD